jgi:tetratricopeptide (TPR) repeat protein
MIKQSDNGVRRLQEEVARDPGSLAFLPLADLYRAQGRLDTARRVCVRGLERHPNHVDGHYLLGRIHRDADEPEKAYDEWDIALRLDPHHMAARRAIAFLCLEKRSMEEADRHLRRALTNDPDDPRILRALRFLERGGSRPPQGAAFWDAVATLMRPRAERFVRETRVRFAVILDVSGRVVAQHGFTPELDLAAFSSLAVGVHSAAREIARVMRQPAFVQHYQGRGEHQIFLGAIPSPAGDLLLVTAFGEEAPVGLVRAVFAELLTELAGAAWPTVAAGGDESLESELAAGLARSGIAGAAVGGRG